MRWLGKERGKSDHSKNIPGKPENLCATNAHLHSVAPVFPCFFFPLVWCPRPTSYPLQSSSNIGVGLNSSVAAMATSSHQPVPWPMPWLSLTCMCLSDLYVLCCMCDAVISVLPACLRPF